MRRALAALGAACASAFLGHRRLLAGLRRPRHAAAVAEAAAASNVTLLAVPGSDVRYLGRNESLFLRYLNYSRRGALRADARVVVERVDADAAAARVAALWKSRRLIVHDKDAYRDLAEGGDALRGQLRGGCRKAASLFEDRAADVAAAGEYVRAVLPHLKPPATAADVKTLLVDFKERYPYYRGRCEVCGEAETDFVGEVAADADEAERAKAGRVELRACAKCESLTRFVRANAVGYALHASKRGRCGEYAAAFRAVLDAAGVRARWVFDTTDHVWCEAWLGGAWVHADPCEASLGEPLLYQGWGKNGTLVVSFDEFEAEDVTSTYYPDQAEGVAARRAADGITEAEVAALLAGYAARGPDGYEP